MGGRREWASALLSGPRRALVLAVVGLACGGAGSGGAGGPLTGRSDAPLIGLQRGGHWSVITIKPPHLSGPLFHLQLRNSVLTGAVSGGTAPAGTLRVTITKEGAEGFGPLGPVALDFNTDEASTVAEGTWNGGRVHLVFARESLKGTVTTNSYFHARSGAATSSNMESMRPRGRFSRASDTLDPLPVDMSCEYYLDQLGSDGALNGGSTCAGMPQQTRLEVPALAKTWLTHAELVTVLVAVLSAPPVVIAEDYGPRFEAPSTQRPFGR